MSIRARGLSKTFDEGKSFALKNVDLEIQQGEFVAIIGLSGAGKSTFLRAINGTNPAGTGSLQVLGREVGTLRGRALADLRKQIGFIFFHKVKNNRNKARLFLIFKLNLFFLPIFLYRF